MKKCYDLEFGLVNFEEEGTWNASTTEIRILCPKCFNKFKLWYKQK